MEQSLIDSSTSIRVSSIQDKSANKKNLIDGSPETCWTSGQGLPQSIQLAFPAPGIRPSAITLTFQGGFVGTRTALYARTEKDETEVNEDWTPLTKLFPEDVNREQKFDIPALENPITRVKLVFESSSDFFGRITIYDLKLYGSRA